MAKSNKRWLRQPHDANESVKPASVLRPARLSHLCQRTRQLPMGGMYRIRKLANSSWRVIEYEMEGGFMVLQRLYLDTTVPSAYIDARAPDRQRLTEEFWRERLPSSEPVISRTRHRGDSRYSR